MEDTKKADEFIIPSIVDSISPEEITNFQPVYQRYYEEKYCKRFSKADQNLDTCIRIHTNKVCVVYISPKHAIVTKNQKINQINFQVSPKTNRLDNKMSGKGKRGAQNLTPDAILCHIETEDGESYPVHAGIHGKLLEINSDLSTNPNIIIDEILCDGFIALILPDLKKRDETLSELVSKEEYEAGNG